MIPFLFSGAIYFSKGFPPFFFLFFSFQIPTLCFFSIFSLKMDNRAIQTLNPLQDSCSPFYMHNESPGAILVSKTLNGENYHSWSRAMWISLKTKNKLQFIDGSLLKPSIDDPSFAVWDRVNTLVVSWLTQSIDASIVQSILWMETTFDIWKDLRERYYQGDVFCIAQLIREIYTYQQGNLSIGAYHTHIKGLWQELDNFRPISACSCTHRCRCSLIPTIKGYKENDYVICFLNGVNDQYEGVRSQIMLMDPLPSVNKAFSLLIQQERHINSQFGESKVLLNTSATEYASSDFGRNIKNNRERGRGRGFQV
ncbi:putative retrotransposon gag domain, gag-polypeptide of LTR copia-type [Lupinus albus]|uniref:Putative retrotransposon gag domain, gag-polypeptide of LTR copia-type n=1 Tax=Lupinus albus TaxID=3870 RepID=A0A6A4P2R3_LUPAL|nr:putative retrotransposon gag domain, gag-polypeptide of LTR copia-type [Lupinus albus]